MNGDLIDRRTAEQNLDIIAHDSVADLAGLQAGWCWAFAPLRSFLTNPEFIKSLREYKARQCAEGVHHFNIDFLKTFFRGQENNEAVEKCLWIVHLLCRATDENGKITNPILIRDLVRHIFRSNGAGEIDDSFDYFALSNALMRHNIDTFYYRIYQANMTDETRNTLEGYMDDGAVIMFGYPGHWKNLYKQDGYYYTLSPYGMYNTLDAAIGNDGHGQFRCMLPRELGENKGDDFYGWNLSIDEMTIANNLEQQNNLNNHQHLGNQSHLNNNKSPDEEYTENLITEIRKLREEGHGTAYDVMQQKLDELLTFSDRLPNNSYLKNQAEKLTRELLST